MDGEFDRGGQAVTTIDVCGDSLVASRHTIFFTAPSPDDEASSQHYTRGSIVVGPVIKHHPALISCFRELTLRFLPDGDRIVFACEVRGATNDRCFLVVVNSKRGVDPSREESIVLICTEKQVENEASDFQLVVGIPVLSTMSIEFRGRGVFGISLNAAPNVGNVSSKEETLYFETRSLHSMWAAIVSLEKVRDAAKANNLYEIDSYCHWMVDYFPDHPHRPSVNIGGPVNDAALTISDPEEEGEGGSAIVVSLNSSNGTHPHRTTPASSFSVFHSGTQNVGIWESEPGVALRLFSLASLRRWNQGISLHRTMSIGAQGYVKPDLEHVNACILSFVSSAQDPDDLSVSDVIDHLKSTFGNAIIGKLGYSSAMIDGLIYRVVGQMEPPSLIIDKLYLGSEYNAANKAELKQLGITHILNVTAEVNKFFPEEFKYHQVCVLDMPSAKIFPFFERAMSFIDSGVVDGGGVLVHCQRGVSRSASFVIAYLMKTRSMTADEAIKFVKQKRRIIKPNTGFVAQLKQWEQVQLDSN